MSKKAYQLGLVTGLKKHSEEYEIKDKIKDTCTDISLCVTGVWDYIKISMLSDEDFEEDECNDLIPLVEKGLLKRTTVAELEEKVAAVHKDIVNHWIDEELVRLGKEIDRAHEKGWHREMEELMHQKRLLSTTAERQRCLDEVPEIIADTEDEKKETELEIAAGNSSQQNRGRKRDRASCLMDMEANYEEATEQVAGSFDVLKDNLPKGAAEHVAESFEVLKEKPPEGLSLLSSCDVFGSALDRWYGIKNQRHRNKEHLDLPASATRSDSAGPTGATEQVVDALSIPNEESSEGAADQVAGYSRVHEEESAEGATGKMAESLDLCNKESSEVASKQGDAAHEVASEAGEALSTGVTPDSVWHSQMHNTQGAQAIDIDEDEGDHSRRDKGSNKVVINLDSDDDEDLHTEQCEPEQHKPVHTKQCEPEQHKPVQAAMNGMSPLTPPWHYVDPQGESRGPFPLMLLSQWRRVGFFGEDFRVWRTGQTVAQAILLTDAFRMNL